VVEQLAEVAGKFIVSPPKTAAGQRVVVLPAIVVAALAEHLDEFAAPVPEGLVFSSGRGTYLQRSNFSRLVWRPAVQQLGLDGLRFHDLRHTAATPCGGRRRDHQGADGAHGAHLASGGPALSARHGRPTGRHRRCLGRPGSRCRKERPASAEGT
jgi:integrase